MRSTLVDQLQFSLLIIEASVAVLDCAVLMLSLHVLQGVEVALGKVNTRCLLLRQHYPSGLMVSWARRAVTRTAERQ